jgi:sulfatase maturation enzyme AslB (radical SAM superfamily)
MNQFDYASPREFVYIDWDMSSRCNYACSYCEPAAHDGKFDFPSLENAKKLVDKTSSAYKDKFLVFNLFGGEPTIWKQIPAFFDYVKSKNKNNKLQLLTNGNKTKKWWLRNQKNIDSVVVSVHVAQVDIVDLVDKFNACAGSFDIHFQICIDIDNFDLAMQQYNYCLKNLNKHIRLDYKPLRVSLDKAESMPYTEKQILIMKSLKTLPGIKLDHYGVSMVNENNKPVNLQNLLLEKKNKFKDWACWIGIDTLNITREGNVTIGSQCFPNFVLGSIHNCDFDIPNIPVKCKYEYCSCLTDLTTKKVKNYTGKLLEGL